MTKIEICPICGSQANEFKVDNEILDFFSELNKKNILNEYLKICKVNFDITRHGAPTTAIATKVMTIVKEEIRRFATDEFGQASEDLPKIIAEALKAKLPNSESIEALIQSIPQLSLAVYELLRKQEVPKKKGEAAELELADELRDNFPQDEVVKLGKSGETDIILQLRKDNFKTGIEIIVESKASTSWRRSYLDEVRTRMSIRNCKMEYCQCRNVLKEPMGSLQSSSRREPYLLRVEIDRTFAYTVLELCY